MCFHACLIPASQCSLCTPPIHRLFGEPPAHCAPKVPHDTDIIVHDDETSDRFDALLVSIHGCLIYQAPDDSVRGFEVNTTLGLRTISPARYALSRAGRRATSSQIVKCTCGRVGDKHGNGVCVTPDHLVTC